MFSSTCWDVLHFLRRRMENIPSVYLSHRSILYHLLNNKVFFFRKTFYARAEKEKNKLLRSLFSVPFNLEMFTWWKKMFFRPTRLFMPFDVPNFSGAPHTRHKFKFRATPKGRIILFEFCVTWPLICARVDSHSAVRTMSNKKITSPSYSPHCDKCSYHCSFPSNCTTCSRLVLCSTSQMKIVVERSESSEGE